MSALIGWSGKESHPVAHVATAFDQIRDVSLHEWRRHNICDESGSSVIALTFPKTDNSKLTQVVSRISDSPYSIRVHLLDNSMRLSDWVTLEGLIGGEDTVLQWVNLLGLDIYTTETVLAEITCFDGDATNWDAPAGTHEKVSAAIVGYITNYLQANDISSKPGVTGDGLRFIDYIGDETSESGSLERTLYPLIHQPYYICSAFYDSRRGKTVLINSDTKPRDTPYFYITERNNGIIYASRPEMMPYGIGELEQEPLPTGALIIYPDHNNSILISDHE